MQTAPCPALPAAPSRTRWHHCPSPCLFLRGRATPLHAARRMCARSPPPAPPTAAAGSPEPEVRHVSYTSIAPQIVTPERRAPTPASLQPPAALITPETSRFTAYHCPRMYSTLGHCSFHVPGLMTEKERNGEKQTGRGAKYPPPRLGVLRPRAAYSPHVPTSEGNLKTVSYTQRI